MAYTANVHMCAASNRTQVCWMLQDAPTPRQWMTLQVLVVMHIHVALKLVLAALK